MGDLYLVTGGAGFIGSHVVAELLRRGHDVRVLDNFSTGRRDNLGAVDADVEVFEGDMRSYERAHNAVEGLRLRHPPRGAALGAALGAGPAHHQRGQHHGHAQRPARRARRGRRAASCWLRRPRSTAPTPRMPKREEMVPQPISPYAVSKLAAEQYARAFATVYGLETVSLRYFNVFGPRQDPTSQYSGVVPRFMRIAIEGGRPIVFGDGLQSRDFTYVANVVDATLSAAAAAGARGQHLQHRLWRPQDGARAHRRRRRVAGCALDPEFAPPRPGDVKHSFADISLAHELLGYEPRVDFERASSARSRGCSRTRPVRRRDTTRLRRTVAHPRHRRHGSRRPVGARPRCAPANVAAWPPFQELCERHEARAHLSDHQRDRRRHRGGGVPEAAGRVRSRRGRGAPAPVDHAAVLGGARPGLQRRGARVSLSACPTTSCGQARDAHGQVE